MSVKENDSPLAVLIYPNSEMQEISLPETVGCQRQQCELEKQSEVEKDCNAEIRSNKNGASAGIRTRATSLEGLNPNQLDHRCLNFPNKSLLFNPWY